VQIHGAAFGSVELSAAAKTPNAVQQPEVTKSRVQYASAKICQNVLLATGDRWHNAARNACSPYIFFGGLGVLEP